MEETFTIEEFKNYIDSQDSLGDVAYFCTAENIRKANEPKKEKKEDEKKVIKMYLHGSKEDAFTYDEQHDLRLSEEALQNFMYALYEVEFDVEVDLKTGDTKILKCNGKELK